MSAVKAQTYPRIENPSTHIYWKDLHEDPGLRMCGLAARGLWTYQMLAIMAGAAGHLAVEGRAITVKQLAALAGRPLAEVTAALNELRDNHVYSVDRHGTPYNRRMVAAQKKAESNRKNGQNGGRPKSLKSKGDSISETQTKPKLNPTHNPNDLPRARGSQDSLSSKEEKIIVPSELLFDEAEIDPQNWKFINGKSSARTAEAIFEKWFWPTYPPLRGPKAPALIEFKRALKCDSAENIIGGLGRYAERRQDVPKADRRYTTHARKWLKDRCWQDELEEFENAD